MAMNQALIGEFDHEMANTRKTIERVPDAKFDWKPHAKSFSMGALAGHLAFIPCGRKSTIEDAAVRRESGGRAAGAAPADEDSRRRAGVFR